MGPDQAADDLVLAGLVKDLDEGFAELVRTQEQAVYSVALRVTGSATEAEDLSAETFLRAYQALTGYDEDRALALRPRPWLLTITLNLWRNSLRDAGRRPRLVPDSLADARPGGADVEGAVEGAESRRELAGLVERLPPAQRAAVVLRHVAGLPIAEVAGVLGCPEGTAKSHVSRGLTRLRALYRAAEPAGLPRLGVRTEAC
jgi:RNA polymerase sigma factor (sigma-70 family)